MRAMSLVSSDSEGEQNELRNLQEKLESTMKLVTNLSGQLSELKDQVKKRNPICPQTHMRVRAHTHTPLTTRHTRFDEAKSVVLRLKCWRFHHLDVEEGSGPRRRNSPGLPISFPHPFTALSQDEPLTLSSVLLVQGFNVKNKTRKWENANDFREVLYRKHNLQSHTLFTSLTDRLKAVSSFAF